MPTVKDVPADKFIEEFAKFLKKGDKVKPPDWAEHARTGHHKELAPYRPDWWYIRCASIARRVFIRKRVGVGGLTKAYGGRKRRGVRPGIYIRGSSSIARKALIQLEDAGIVEKVRKGEEEGGEFAGRQVTHEGQRHLNEIADEVYKNLNP